MDPKEGLSDEEAARFAWNCHTMRNESVITDLFYGQYKSTINCNQCDRVSVTFDPMSTVMVTIPQGSVTMDFFYLPYNIGQDFINYQGTVTIKANDTMTEFRQKIKETYDINMADYTICIVKENEFKRYLPLNAEFPEDII